MLSTVAKLKNLLQFFYLFNPTNLSFLLYFNAVSCVNLVPNPTAMMALQWFQLSSGGATVSSGGLHNIHYATVSDSLLVEFNSSLKHNQFMATLPTEAASQGFQIGAKRKGFEFLSCGEDGFQGKACWWLADSLGLVCRIW